MRRGSKSLVLSIGALALFASACGGVPAGSVEAESRACPPDSDCYDPPRASGEGGAVTVAAVEFAFPEIDGIAAEGDIAVTIDNQGSAEHNIFVIGANEGSEQPVQALGGEQATGTINLFAGEYTFYCTIPGHREAGMESTIVVYTTADDAPADVASETPSDDASEAPSEDASPSETTSEG